MPLGPARGPRDWFPEWVRGPAPRRVLAYDWSGSSAVVVAVAGRRLRPGLVLRRGPVVAHPRPVGGRPLCRGPGQPRAPGPAAASADAAGHRAGRRAGGSRPGPSARWVYVAGLRPGRRAQVGPAAAAGCGLGGPCRGLQRAGRSNVSGCPNTVVVPNGADAPDRPVTDRRALRGAAPTLGFVGALDYEPNHRAVEWFVREVLPAVRARPRGRPVPGGGPGQRAARLGCGRARGRPGGPGGGPAGGARPHRRVRRAHPGGGRDPAEGGGGAVEPPADGHHDGRLRGHPGRGRAVGTGRRRRPRVRRGLRASARRRRPPPAPGGRGGGAVRGRPTPGHPSGSGSRTWPDGPPAREPAPPAGPRWGQSRTTAGEWRKNCSTSRS